MGFLTSIFNPGTGVAHNGPQPAAPSAPAAPTAAPAPAPAPAAPELTPEQQALSQLDTFKTLWQTPTTADGKPAPLPQDPLRQPIFNLDPNKVVESTGKLDFLAGVPQDKIQSALGGDVSAFAEVLNSAVRQAVAGVTISNGQVLNQALLENNSRLTSTLPTQIKKVQLMEEDGSNPIFEHEAVQPLVNSLKQMAFARNPNASPADIKKEISGYLTGLATALTETSPTKVQQRQQQARSEQDWSTFL